MTAYSPPSDNLKLYLRDRLLWDTIQVFQMLDNHNWVPVTVILPELLKMRRWGRYRNETSGRTFTAHTLVEFLHDMEIDPERQTWTDGKRHAGYTHRDLIECWKSWDFTEEMKENE